MSSNRLTHSLKSQAFRIVYWQFAIVVVVAFLAFIARGWLDALSLLVGGVAYVLPNMVFVWRVFNYANMRQIEMFVVAFFLGETAKLLISAVLFILIVKFFAVNVVWTLVGYISALLAFWIASFLCLSKATG